MRHAHRYMTKQNVSEARTNLPCRFCAFQMTESDVRSYAWDIPLLCSPWAFPAPLVVQHVDVLRTMYHMLLFLQTKDVEVNFSQMFLNTVEGLEAGGAKLQHVQFVSGEACRLHTDAHTQYRCLGLPPCSPRLLMIQLMLCKICRWQMV
jgi:hypothetical protein